MSSQDGVTAIPYQVGLVDNTLREGDETPGVRFRTQDKVRLARQLDRLGVDVVEVGIPGQGPDDFAAVKAVVESGLKARIAAIGRVFQPEYNTACLQAGVDIVHLSVLTSAAGIEYVLRRSRLDIIDASARAVKELTQSGVGVFFSATDGSRADSEFLTDLFRAVEHAGAEAVVLADTMGIMSPPMVAAAVRRLRSTVTIPLSVHFHNDFGLAVANALAGVEAGARMADVSLCGLGARVGNTNLAEFVLALHQLYGGRTGVRTEYLMETVQLLSEVTGLVPYAGWPVVGSRAFCTIAGKGLQTYPGPIREVLASQLMTPEMVGNRAMVFGDT